MRWVAFLRGINVGGHKPVRMDDLRTAFEEMGFQDIKTILASGNVLFESPDEANAALRTKIEETLKRTAGYEIGVLLRTTEELLHLVDLRPFVGVEVTPQTRLYVTFLPEGAHRGAEVPYHLPVKDFQITRLTEGEVCSVVTLSAERGTVDLMGVLEKEFGRNVTTRSWNTISKILMK